ncbi:MAG TPA: hypothetical protein PLU73_00935, partial [Bacteroidia bacterium]|nr:hypothetical protein [Bacteroidia bacterium]
MKSFFLTIFLLLSSVFLAQRGKNLAGNITVANTIVNAYTPLTSNAAAGSNVVNVVSSGGFTVGDLVFIIQMQGASVNAGRDTLFPDVQSAIPTNSTFGAVTAYNNCGNYEFAQVLSIPNNTSIQLDCGLKYSYSYLNKVQVIRVPRYTTLSVSGAGNIVCPQWNGATGGVIVVEVANNCTLSATPSFNASGLGFRGGAAVSTLLAFVGGGNKYGHISDREGAYKGESINGDTVRYQAYSSQHCRGAMANGGGGGDTHNAGGG